MADLELDRLIARLGLDSREFERGLTQAERRMRETERRLGEIGRTLTTRVSLPLSIIGTIAIKASADFETAMTGVAKTVDAPAEAIARLGETFQDMSETSLPTSARGLARIGELAGQLGVQFEAIPEFTETVAQLGVATNLSAEQAATSLARLANIMQTSQDQFDNLGSVIVRLGNNLATTEAEITEMALRLAGAGRTVGLTEAQVLGLAGALSSVGIQAQAGGTALSRVLLEIGNSVAQGTQEVSEFARIAGLSVDQFTELFERDAAAALVRFIEGIQRVDAAGENLFAILERLGLNEIRVRDALLRLAGAGELLGRSLNLASDEFQRNTALSREASRFFDRLAADFSRLRNQLENTAAIFGDALRPAVELTLSAAEATVEALQEMARAFRDMDPAVRGFVGILGGLAIVLGPALLTLRGLIAIAPRLSALLGASGIAGASGAARLSFTAFSAAAGAAATSLGTLGLATGGAIIALEALDRSVKTLRPVLRDLATIAASEFAQRFPEGIEQGIQDALAVIEAQQPQFVRALRALFTFGEDIARDFGPASATAGGEALRRFFAQQFEAMAAALASEAENLRAAAQRELLFLQNPQAFADLLGLPRAGGLVEDIFADALGVPRQGELFPRGTLQRLQRDAQRQGEAIRSVLATEFAELDLLGEILPDEAFDPLDEKIALVTDKIIDAVEELGAQGALASPRVQELVAQLEALTATASAASAEDVLSAMARGFGELGLQAQIIGPRFDQVGAALDVVEQAIEDLRGVVPASNETLQDLIRTAQGLRVFQDESQGIDRLNRILSEFAETTANATSEVSQFERERRRIVAELERDLAEGRLVLPEGEIPSDFLSDLRNVVAEAEQELDRSANRISVDIGGAFTRVADEMVTGVLRGTRDSIDIMEGFRNVGISIFSDMFSQILANMLRDFNLRFENNLSGLLQSVGSFAIDAASFISGIFGGGGGGGSDAGTLANLGSLAIGAFGFQHGGIVREPTLAALAETGNPEAVIPLDRLDEFVGEARGTDFDVVIRNESAVPLREQRRVLRSRSGRRTLEITLDNAIARSLAEGGSAADVLGFAPAPTAR